MSDQQDADPPAYMSIQELLSHTDYRPSQERALYTRLRRHGVPQKYMSRPPGAPLAFFEVRAAAEVLGRRYTGKIPKREEDE